MSSHSASARSCASVSKAQAPSPPLRMQQEVVGMVIVPSGYPSDSLAKDQLSTDRGIEWSPVGSKVASTLTRDQCHVAGSDRVCRTALTVWLVASAVSVR